MMIASGDRLGSFEILAQLGAGGMDEVWRGRDTRLNRDVAIKDLPADFAKDADRLRRFEQLDEIDGNQSRIAQARSGQASASALEVF